MPHGKLLSRGFRDAPRGGMHRGFLMLWWCCGTCHLPRRDMVPTRVCYRKRVRCGKIWNYRGNICVKFLCGLVHMHQRLLLPRRELIS